MSIAESEALTRRMQEQQWYPSEEQAEDEDHLDNNPDAYIDPAQHFSRRSVNQH